MSLAARQIEQAGIPTVIIGSARDVVEECGVPRFVFVDFPLGNPCGKPHDVEMQRANVGLALDLLTGAFAPRTTVQAPVRWCDDNVGADNGDVDNGGRDIGDADNGDADNVGADEGWRDRYMHVGDDNREALARAGERRRRLQAEAHQS